MYCSNCGSKCNDSANFCTNCGNSLSNTDSLNDNNCKNGNDSGAINLQSDKKQKKVKIFSVFGVIVCILIMLFSAALFIANAATIDELFMPSTMITPLFMFALFFASSVLGIIACIKRKKKIVIAALCMFLVACLLYPACRVINGNIKNNTYETVMYDDLYSYCELNSAKDKKIQIKGEVVYGSYSDEYDAFLVDVSNTNIEKIIFVRYEGEDDIKENSEYTFYGSVLGIYNDTPSIMVDFLEENEAD